MTSPPNQSEQFQMVLALYNNVYQHIRDYKATQWRVLAMIVAVLAGIVAASKIGFTSENVEVAVRTLLSVVAVTIGVYGCWHLLDLQRGLTWQRQVRRKIERMWQFHDEGVYCEGTLLPLKQDDSVSLLRDLPRLISWWGMIGLAATYALVAIWAGG